MRTIKEILKTNCNECKEGSDWFQIAAILSMSLSAFSVGALFTWTSPTIPILISDEFPGDITFEQASYLTVIPPIAVILGTPFFASLMDRMGRKKTLLLMAIPHIIVWLIIMFSESIYAFYVSRFINGLADGCMFTVIPTYMSEIATPSVRGSWGNVLTLFIYIGQFFINGVGGYCSIKTTAYIFFGVPFLYLATIWIMPESPYYLIMKNNHDEARKSLQKFRRKHNVEEELNQLILDVNRQTGESGKWKDLILNPTHRKGLIAGIFVRTAQQYSGIAAFSTYTIYLFNEAGSGVSNTVAAMMFSLSVAITNAVSSITLDKLGRRLAMIISCAGCAIVLLLQTIFFYFKDYTSVDVSGVSWLPLLFMFMYVLIYGIGLGIVPTLIIGELFSASVKAKGVSALNISFCVCVMTSTKLFQFTTANYGLIAPFLVFTLCCVISTVLSFYLVPETKGKTLEEIQQSMKK